ncbi:polysaccharide lyase family 1 protein [Ideonella sp. DXS29W]|uniref:pectin lyase n=1 Tax=Ideonella lacteola TaxID=2984193 RepID=A0ABU9BUD7_9BURK
MYSPRRVTLLGPLLAGAVAFIGGPAAGATWTKVADENKSFTVQGTQNVRYGTGNNWVTKVVTGSATCSNSYFGADPYSGVRKQCQVPVASVWTKIASEGAGFSVAGTQNIRYGSGNAWVTKSVTAAGQCTNTYFGSDPAPGTKKECRVSDAASETPTGYGRTVTGGAGAGGADIVTISRAADLPSALCRSYDSAGYCNDKTPRIIKISGVLDFRNTQGKASSNGCVYNSCTDSKKNELILTTTSPSYCAGKTNFSVTYDAAGANPMQVGSNKTIIGVGDASGIKGRGLRIIGGNSNIIVRNLTISDINDGIIFAGDAITLDNADRIWIDHNRIERIGRQFIVSGYGTASNTTISNNDFNGADQYGFYCDGRHYWNLMFVGANDTMTFTGNWVRHFTGRAPKFGGSGVGQLHMVNNYFYDSGSGHALESASPSSVLIESNYFQSVNQPILKDAKSGYVFAPLGSLTTAASNACKAAFSRDCGVNVATPPPSENNFTLDQVVLDRAKGQASGVIVAPNPAADLPTRVPNNVGPRSTVF